MTLPDQFKRLTMVAPVLTAVSLLGGCLVIRHTSGPPPTSPAQHPGSAAPQLPPSPTTPSPTPAPRTGLPGTDTQGWKGSKARCDPGNPPAVIARTTNSILVVCQAGPGKYYYRAVRVSDGASIELANAVRTSAGFDVTNPADGTRYQVRANVLKIIGPAGQDTSEPMVQYVSG